MTYNEACLVRAHIADMFGRAYRKRVERPQEYAHAQHFLDAINRDCVAALGRLGAAALMSDEKPEK